MRYFAIATDFDGTLAHDGLVNDEAIEALLELRKSGRKVILVTGRLMESLRSEFPRLDLFDAVVAENGAILYETEKRETVVLSDPPPAGFVERLREHGVSPLEVGDVIVSTWEPHETTVVETIRELGLERQVIFNKGAVMTLPSGVNKATGLQAALDRFDLSPHNVVGVGDAENDHAFLQLCELSAAVANALPALKERADLVLKADHGFGVAELVRRLMADDCGGCPTKRDRAILLGRADGEEVFMGAYAEGVTLIEGSSGSGKSTLATGIVERVMDAGYQVCIVDPEGDYDAFPGLATLGDPESPPNIQEIESLLESPRQSLAVNLFGMPVDSRADFAAQLMPRLTALRARTGRPHWIVLDEAHQLMRKERDNTETVPSEAFGLLAITTSASLLSQPFAEQVQMCITVGAEGLKRGEASLRRATEPQNRKCVFELAPPRAALRRHRRKYATGDLAPEKSFYFRGKDGALNIRAQNLSMFVQIAEGIDDETWLHHLRRGDIAGWFHEMIGDDDLAQIACEVEGVGAAQSRKAVVDAIHDRYTASAQ